MSGKRDKEDEGGGGEIQRMRGKKDKEGERKEIKKMRGKKR